MAGLATNRTNSDNIRGAGSAPNKLKVLNRSLASSLEETHKTESIYPNGTTFQVILNKIK
jgi:hypothetical protein